MYMYIVKAYKWLWILLLLWSVTIVVLFQTHTITKSCEVILAAPRDIAPGAKDPYFISSIAMVWEPLVGIDEYGNIKGQLATHWSHNEENTIWTFYLRPNVQFHDGSPFNAQSVVDNVHRWRIMGRKPSPFYSFNFEAMYPGLVDVVATDIYTVTFYLEHADPVFVERLINFSSAMFNPNSFDKHTGDFINFQIGTGPFKIYDQKKNQYVELIRNDFYYGRKAQIERIRIKSIPNVNTRYMALKAEEIVGVIDIGAMSPALTEDLLQDSRFALTTNRNTLNQVLTVNQWNWPFSDARMIEALSLMIDRKALIDTYFTKQAIPYSNILNDLNPYAMVIENKHDVEKAKLLANEVLGSQRVNAILLIPQYGLARYSYKEVAQYYQAIFKELGIDISIKILEGAAHKKLVSQGEYDFSMGTMGMANYAPESIFTTYLSNNGSINKLYHIGYYDDEAEHLLSNLNHAKDIKEHIDLYNNLQLLSQHHMPVIVVGSDKTALIYNKNKISGFYALPYGVTLDTIHWSTND